MPREMHFDHVRGEKLFVLAEGAVKSWAAIKAEIAKCEIRCRPCHEARHRVERWRAQLAGYGLTMNAFDRMLAEQAGRCAACADPLVEVDVDLDNHTGAVRGLLCRSCNAAAGMAGDDPARLRQIAAYLEAP